MCVGIFWCPYFMITNMRHYFIKPYYLYFSEEVRWYSKAKIFMVENNINSRKNTTFNLILCHYGSKKGTRAILVKLYVYLLDGHIGFKFPTFASGNLSDTTFRPLNPKLTNKKELGIKYEPITWTASRSLGVYLQVIQQRTNKHLHVIRSTADRTWLTATHPIYTYPH